MAKRLLLNDLVRHVILDTGLAKNTVETVVISFLANVQELSLDHTVDIRGFGSFKSTMKTRKYYDINKRLIDDTTISVKPKIRFTPSNSFLRMVERERKKNAS